MFQSSCGGPRSAIMNRMFIKLPLFLLVFNHALSETDFKRCNNAITHGYGYRQFYKILEGAKVSSEKEIDLTLEFYVKAESDAHVLLSSSEQLTDDLKAYEIVIGGGKNTFSQIRILKKGKKASKETINFVSGIEHRGFWVKVSSNGLITVGKTGESEEFMFWMNSEPFPIKYFAFSTWWNVKGDWLFGCPEQNDPDFVEVEQNFSSLQRLRRDLLTFYDPYAVPNEVDHLLVVKAELRTVNVQLDERSALLAVSGTAKLTWNDEKLVWNPEHYEGIKTIYLRSYQLWTPNLKVLSGLAYTDMLDLSRGALTVTYGGNVSWSPPMHFSTFCSINIKNWPYDVHNCSITIGFWMEPLNLRLQIMEEENAINNDLTGSEWQILQVSHYKLPSEVDLAIVEMSFLMARRHEYYTSLLLTPFCAAGMMILASFWIQPDQSGQLFLSCANLVILTLMLMSIGNRIPVMQEKVPNIILLYCCGIITTCIPLVLAVWLKNLSKSFQVYPIVASVLSNPIIEAILCLPATPQDLSIYAHLHEHQLEEEKMNKERINLQVLATAIQRMVFVPFFLAFSYLIFFQK